MSERAQMGPTPIWPVVTVTIGLIVILIVNDIRERVGAAPFEQVEHVCGLCGADWTPVASLLIIAALVLVVNLVARSGVAPTVFRYGDDE